MKNNNYNLFGYLREIEVRNRNIIRWDRNGRSTEEYNKCIKKYSRLENILTSIIYEILIITIVIYLIGFLRNFIQ